MYFASEYQKRLDENIHEYDLYRKGILQYKRIDTKKEFEKYNIDDVISIKGLSGHYMIKEKLLKTNKIRIYCKKWVVLYKSGLRDSWYRDIGLSDVSKIIRKAKFYGKKC